MDMREFLMDTIWAVDRVLFRMHEKLFPKHFAKQLDLYPDHVSFLTELGFRVGKFGE